MLTPDAVAATSAHRRAALLGEAALRRARADLALSRHLTRDGRPRLRVASGVPRLTAAWPIRLVARPDRRVPCGDCSPASM
jgi:hypothetical protein